MRTAGFAKWTKRFEDERELRRAQGDPDWERGATLPRAVWAGIQRFQVGEDGDGANLVGKADQAGDADYAQAVRLFVAEEQNHARLLARLLAAGGMPTLTGHWSDAAFVRLRRLMGLRMELLVLMIAEVVALRYYRALRDGTDDALTTDVAARILSDEQRHVPFHCERLHTSLAELPRPVRRPVMTLWRLLLLAVSLVVCVDHGPALHRLGIGRLRFVADVMTSSHEVLTAVLTPRPDAWTSEARGEPEATGCRRARRGHRIGSGRTQSLSRGNGRSFQAPDVPPPADR
ncbi:ferritin-like domain-containing protein [Streptomyces sp. NPDC059445]|uniref:ferritin-like domain-containing protein n=1 Tax=Streptomyces sp. NPDC059445 TaxID=3346832 RepID=UPI0036772DA8